MSRPLPRKLMVINKQKISCNMLRITLGGDALQDFPLDQESGYIKLHFAKEDVLEGDIEQQLRSDDAQTRPTLRTYTVRQQRQDPCEIDVDFVVHEGGPASDWAINSQQGEQIYVAGPGKKKLVDVTADWFFLAADMTALPAISVNLALLPDNARGYAVIEVLEQADIQPLAFPENFELHWVINNHQQGTSLLLDAVKALPPLPGKPSVWLACEFTSMRALRQYFHADLQINRRSVYASSYWKLGLTEEEHKRVKSVDNLAEQA
ncbi:MAG: siderophore-interacting protein [Osedax symbiont Rs2]|nr:MAG: siderophore-interacting protein [Osedax symbiont Rs2]